MPAGDEQFREDLDQAEKMEEYSFDELAKGLATGALSRRQALKLVGAALLGSALGFFSLQGLAEGQEVEAAAGCSGPAIDNDRCVANRCGGTRRRRRQACVCAETAGGGRACVDLRGERCPNRDQCDRDADCRADQVCIKVGGCCGGRRNLCVSRCGS